MVRVKVDTAISRRKEPRHLRQVLILRLVVLFGPDMEVTVSPAIHILFLSDCALDIGSAGTECVGHVEHGEAPAVLTGERERYITPITLQYSYRRLDTSSQSISPPSSQIYRSELMIPILRLAPLKSRKSLTKHPAPLRAIWPRKSPRCGLGVGTQSPASHTRTRHSGLTPALSGRAATHDAGAQRTRALAARTR